MSPGLARVAILGAGRAGCALHAALQARGYPLLLWTRSEGTAAAARQDGFSTLSGPLPGSLKEAELVFLAVNDGAVGSVAQALARENLVRPRAVVAHLAGALDLEPLEPLSRLASVGSLHPLVPIASRRATFEGAACAIESSDASAAARLEAVARDLGLSILHPTGDRARYHAAACFVGNYPQVLMEAAVRLLQDAGLSRNEARTALGPLLRAAAENAIGRDGVDSLSGPVLRGDTEVVERHLAALRSNPARERVLSLYRAAAALAAEMTGERADAIARLL